MSWHCAVNTCWGVSFARPSIDADICSDIFVGSVCLLPGLFVEPFRRCFASASLGREECCVLRSMRPLFSAKAVTSLRRSAIAILPCSSPAMLSISSSLFMNPLYMGLRFCGLVSSSKAGSIAAISLLRPSSCLENPSLACFSSCSRPAAGSCVL